MKRAMTAAGSDKRGVVQACAENGACSDEKDGKMTNVRADVEVSDGDTYLGAGSEGYMSRGV